MTNHQDYQRRIIIILSGRGSNFINLHRHLQQQPHHQLVAVASDNPHADGLDYAQKHHLPILHLPYGQGRTAAERILADYVAAHHVDFILLAGFMRILSPDFVARHRDRIINIHPSLLPRHPGLHTHEKVLASGDKEHGCSVHVVDERVDGGRLLAQRRLTVDPTDTAASLAERVLALEHELYPFVLQHLENLLESSKSSSPLS